jgi:hypothetical protein
MKVGVRNKPIKEMDQKPFVARIRDRTLVDNCFRRTMTERECFEHIQGLHPLDYPARSTISRYYEKLHDGTLTLTDRHSGGRKYDEELVFKISHRITENPYLSLRELAKLVSSNKDAVSRILHYVLCLSLRYSKWIPHSLSVEQKTERVRISKQMLKLLQLDEKNNFSHIFTGDESWFFYDYPLTSYWASPGTSPKEVAKRTISTSKVMLVICWGVFQTPVLHFLPRGESMTADKFKEYVMKPLLELNNSLSVEEKLFIHFDNARPHKAKSIQSLMTDEQLINIPQPPYSPDIAPSDFFLFGYIKTKLKGKSFNTAEELLEEIKKIVAEITPEMRLSVFKAWMERLKRIIETGREYI